MNNLQLACVVALAVTGCSHHEDAASVQTTGIAQVQGAAVHHAKIVGGPCSEGDGWTPTPLATAPAQLARSPVVGDPVPVTPVPSGWMDYPQLPSGTIYCLRPDGRRYPYGYFTSNCQKDSDCPAASRCDGTQCRATCKSDSQCTSPTRCLADTAVRFCGVPDESFGAAD